MNTQNLPIDVLELIKIASLHFDDGAIHTAADRLERAALLVRGIAVSKDKLLERDPT